MGNGMKHNDIMFHLSKIQCLLRKFELANFDYKFNPTNVFMKIIGFLIHRVIL